MKVAPALAAGCSIILKPAELTSLSALRLADILARAGVPKGVFNVVTGHGATAGAALASHPGVDKIAFTGSTATGRAIVRASADNLARVTLELGGKSPAIVLPDAELDLAIPGIANGIFGNGGQVCVANSRVYAHEDIFDTLVEGLAAQAAGLALGHQLNPDTAMGPLVSAAQAERVAGFVDEARGDGAGIVCGGDRLGETGAFFAPTIVADIAGSHRISREEVFGPVLVVHRYRDLDAVVGQANATPYGLAASVWTRSSSHPTPLSPLHEPGPGLLAAAMAWARRAPSSRRRSSRISQEATAFRGKRSSARCSSSIAIATSMPWSGRRTTAPTASPRASGPDPSPTRIACRGGSRRGRCGSTPIRCSIPRSEEHTSELPALMR